MVFLASAGWDGSEFNGAEWESLSSGLKSMHTGLAASDSYLTVLEQARKRSLPFPIENMEDVCPLTYLKALQKVTKHLSTEHEIKEAEVVFDKAVKALKV